MRFSFTDRAAPFCEVGFDDLRIVMPSAGTWDVSLWDDPAAIWAGTEPTWRDISCEVWTATTEYGRRAATDRFVPGVANVLARNLDGWGDPSTLGLRPGRPLRFGVDHVVYGRVVLFRGFIDAVVPTYDPSFTATVELQCIDALAEVNRAALLAFDPPQGEGQLAHERVNAILDRAAWPPTKRDVWATSIELIADAQGGQVADLLSRISDSVGGAVFGDHEASIAFRNADWQFFDPIAPVDAFIGNLLPTDVCPGAWQRPFDRASFSTRVIMGRDPETAQQVDDIIGQALYGIETLERTDLLTQSDADVLTLTQRTLEARSHETMPRVRSVSLDARMGDDQLDVMTTVDVFKPSHYQCRLVETDGRLVFDDRYMATAVAHELTGDGWTLEMNLDLAVAFAASGGRWETAGWDISTWSAGTTSARLAARELLNRIEALT